MTGTTDISQPTDNSGLATEPSDRSQRRSGRLNQALAWVGLVAGGLFIVAAIFFSGFFLSWALNHSAAHHPGAATMACCSQMKPGEQMNPGEMKPRGMKPGGMMPAKSTAASPAAPRP